MSFGGTCWSRLIGSPNCGRRWLMGYVSSCWSRWRSRRKSGKKEAWRSLGGKKSWEEKDEKDHWVDLGWHIFSRSSIVFYDVLWGYNKIQMIMMISPVAACFFFRSWGRGVRIFFILFVGWVVSFFWNLGFSGRDAVAVDHGAWKMKWVALKHRLFTLWISWSCAELVAWAREIWIDTLVVWMNEVLWLM